MKIENGIPTYTVEEWAKYLGNDNCCDGCPGFLHHDEMIKNDPELYGKLHWDAENKRILPGFYGIGTVIHERGEL